MEACVQTVALYIPAGLNGDFTSVLGFLGELRDFPEDLLRLRVPTGTITRESLGH